MIRNLKVLGLAAMAAFALSAVGASAASAEEALFTAEVGAGETAHIDGKQIGEGDRFTVGSSTLSCKIATLTGNPVGENDEPQAGPESTYVALEPTYGECHVIRFGITKPATVTTNGCYYTFNATKETAETPFSADLTIVCPGEPEQIEIHVYEDEEHTKTICTYDIGHQTINNAIQLTNVISPENGKKEIVAHIKATVAMTNTMESFTCTTQNSAVYDGEDTLQATKEASATYVNTSVS